MKKMCVLLLVLIISIGLPSVCMGAESPITPSNLKATTEGPERVQLAWDAPDYYRKGGIYTCIIEQSENNGNFQRIYKGQVCVDTFLINKLLYHITIHHDFEYKFRVTHYISASWNTKKERFEELKSSAATVTYVPKPNAPSSLTIMISETKGNAFDLVWENKSEAKGHSSIIKTWNKGVNSETIDVASGVYYTDTNVKPDIVYSYQVKSLSKDGKVSSDPSNTVSISSIPSPTDLKATKTSSSRCVLTWKYQASPNTRLVLERKPIFDQSYTTLATLPYNTTRFVDNISLKTGYSYRVKAIDKNNQSSYYANYAEWKPTIIKAIKLTAKAVSPTQINISWKNTYGDKAEFVVYRTGPDGKKEFKAPAKSTSFQDKTVKPGCKYLYTVDVVM
ncbi:MAG: hypothetical protein ACM3UZ_06820 [Acidobacteriota bacterium]